LKPCVMNHETSSFHQKQLDAQRNLWWHVHEVKAWHLHWRKFLTSRSMEKKSIVIRNHNACTQVAELGHLGHTKS
jgi:hypothetical protein